MGPTNKQSGNSTIGHKPVVGRQPFSEGQFSSRARNIASVVEKTTGSSSPHSSNFHFMNSSVDESVDISQGQRATEAILHASSVGARSTNISNGSTAAAARFNSSNNSNHPASVNISPGSFKQFNQSHIHINQPPSVSSFAAAVSGHHMPGPSSYQDASLGNGIVSSVANYSNFASRRANKEILGHNRSPQPQDMSASSKRSINNLNNQNNLSHQMHGKFSNESYKFSTENLPDDSVLGVSSPLYATNGLNSDISSSFRTGKSTAINTANPLGSRSFGSFANSELSNDYNTSFKESLSNFTDGLTSDYGKPGYIIGADQAHTHLQQYTNRQSYPSGLQNQSNHQKHAENDYNNLSYTEQPFQSDSVHQQFQSRQQTPIGPPQLRSNQLNQISEPVQTSSFTQKISAPLPVRLVTNPNEEALHIQSAVRNTGYDAKNDTISQENVDPERVAYFFILEYYQRLNKGSSVLCDIYDEEGSLYWVSGIPRVEGRVPFSFRAIGKKNVEQVFQKISVGGTKTTIETIFVLPSLMRSYVVAVKGIMWLTSGNEIKFTQTFVIIERSLNWFFVLNDLLCFIDAEVPWINDKNSEIEIEDNQIDATRTSDESRTEGARILKMLQNSHFHSNHVEPLKTAENEPLIEPSANQVFSGDSFMGNNVDLSSIVFSSKEKDLEDDALKMNQVEKSDDSGLDVRCVNSKGAMRDEDVYKLPAAKLNRKVNTTDTENALLVEKSHKDSIISNKDNNVVPSTSKRVPQNTQATKVFPEQSNQDKLTVFSPFLPANDEAIKNAIQELLGENGGHVVSISRSKNPKKNFGFILLDSESAVTSLLASQLKIADQNITIVKINPQFRQLKSEGLKGAKFNEWREKGGMKGNNPNKKLDSGGHNNPLWQKLSNVELKSRRQ